MKASLALTALLLAPWPLAAHPSPAHSLKQLEEHLAETPDDPELLRQKAEILLERRRPKLAAKVVAKLMKQDAAKPEHRLMQARLDALSGEAEKAHAGAKSLVTDHPEFIRGWKFLATLDEAGGRRDEAIAAMGRYLELEPKPDPSDVLTCAGWLKDRKQPGDAREAVRVLDRGLSRVGLLAGLQEMAIGIEIQLGDFDPALKRIDALEARHRPTVALAVRRADILEAAGRRSEAAVACDAAIALMDLAPASRKRTGSFQSQLEALNRRKAENLAFSTAGG